MVPAGRRGQPVPLPGPPAGTRGPRQPRPVGRPRPPPAGRSTESERADEAMAALDAVRRPPRRASERRWCSADHADLSEADVAAALGCSVGTVKSQLLKARAALAVDLGRPIGARRGHGERRRPWPGLRTWTPGCAPHSQRCPAPVGAPAERAGPSSRSCTGPAGAGGASSLPVPRVVVLAIGAAAIGLSGTSTPGAIGLPAVPGSPRAHRAARPPGRTGRPVRHGRGGGGRGSLRRHVRAAGGLDIQRPVPGVPGGRQRPGGGRRGGRAGPGGTSRRQWGPGPRCRRTR